MPRNTGIDVLKLVVCCTIVWLTGCTTGSVLTRPGEPGPAPAQPVLQQPALQHNGSIYMSSVPRPLFEDIKARQVGDLLTVILDEQTDASKSAAAPASQRIPVRISVRRPHRPTRCSRPRLPMRRSPIAARAPRRTPMPWAGWRGSSSRHSGLFNGIPGQTR